MAVVIVFKGTFVFSQCLRIYDFINHSVGEYDVVFLNGYGNNVKKKISRIKKINKEIKIFETTYHLVKEKKVNKKDRFVAFAGIGTPDNFKKTLDSHGFNVTKFLSYPDHYNYFCLPFLTSSPKRKGTLALHSLLVVMNAVLCLVCCSSYSFLLIHTVRQKRNTHLKAIKERQKTLQKFAMRTTLVITSTLLSWLPSIILQILILCGIQIMPFVVLWIVLVSLFTNVILDPILIVRMFINAI